MNSATTTTLKQALSTTDLHTTRVRDASMRRRGIAILSGGLDSAVALADALHYGIDVVKCVAFYYGQRHFRELKSAEAIALWYGIPLQRISLPTEPFGAKSALLAQSENEPPKNRSFDEMIQGIAPTFVPGRNLIFLSHVAAVAYTHECTEMIGGWHWDDSSGYPDCRATFLKSAMESIQRALDDPEMNIYAPLIEMSKGDIVRLGAELNVPFQLTWSCYNGQEEACGTCDTCLLRLKGFADAGLVDPIPYKDRV